MRLLFEVLLRVKSLLRILVERLEVRNVWSIRQEVREVLAQLLNQHSELGAPVADVIDTLDLVAEVLEYTANAVTLNRTAEMTDVHVFGNVRA